MGFISYISPKLKSIMTKKKKTPIWTISPKSLTGKFITKTKIKKTKKIKFN